MPDNADIKLNNANVMPDGGNVMPVSGKVMPNNGNVVLNSGDVELYSGSVGLDDDGVEHNIGDVGVSNLKGRQPQGLPLPDDDVGCFYAGATFDLVHQAIQRII